MASADRSRRRRPATGQGSPDNATWDRWIGTDHATSRASDAGRHDVPAPTRLQPSLVQSRVNHSSTKSRGLSARGSMRVTLSPLIL